MLPAPQLVRLAVEQQLDAVTFLAAPDLHERAGVYDRRQQLVVLAEAEVVDRRAVRQRDAVEVDDEAAARALGDVGCVARDPVGDVDQRVRVRRQRATFVEPDRRPRELAAAKGRTGGAERAGDDEDVARERRRLGPELAPSGREP